MQTMRILSIPFGSILCASFLLVFSSIEFLMAMPEVIFFIGLLYAKIVRIGKTVPSPLTLCAKRYTIAVVLGEGLQTSDISCKGEGTITHAKRGKRIYFGDDRIIAFYQSFAVDGFGIHAENSQRSDEKCREKMSHTYSLSIAFMSSLVRREISSMLEGPCVIILCDDPLDADVTSLSTR